MVGWELIRNSLRGVWVCGWEGVRKRLKHGSWWGFLDFFTDFIDFYRGRGSGISLCGGSVVVWEWCREIVEEGSVEQLAGGV